MLKNNKIIVFLIILFGVLLLFTTSSFASTIGTYNYDVITLTSEEKAYIKNCSNAVLDYCSNNSIDLEKYPYYFILSNTEKKVDFSSTGELFHIVLAGNEVIVSDEWSGCLNGNADYVAFDFNTGSEEILNVSFDATNGTYGNGDGNTYFTVYYTNYSNEYVTANDSISFFPVALQGTLAPIVQESRLEGVLKEIVEILPVVLVTIVGLIGLRKALAFLSKVLRRS